MWKKNCVWICVRRQDEEVATLDYRHSSLINVPSDIFTCERTLEELFLDSNRIRDLPRELFYCHGLRYLHLSDNELVTIPSMIGSLVNLEHLDISKNAIISLPDEMNGCKNLQLFEASVNPLVKVPEGLTKLVSLTEVYLNDTFLECLPTSFARLNQLKVLELRENKLQSLPNSLSSLIKLERLDLGMNEFNQMPEVVGSLISLQELWLDNNRLSGIMPLIGNLQRLTFLDVSKNYIDTVASEIEHCISLTDLHLSCNRIQHLPHSIGKLSSLVTLKVEDNCLMDLPFSMGGMVSLTELDLSSNNLECLPKGLGLLRFLRTLYVDDNFLTCLPVELGSCSQLTILSLRTNNLVQIPDEIGRIPHLKVLNLADNKIQCLPFGLTKLKELKALWLADNQTKPLVKLQTEIDRATGQRTLTCYLLPQHSSPIVDEDRSMDNERNSDGGGNKCNDRRIHFQPDSLFIEQSNLHRTPTPYPKELKRRLERQRDQLAINDRLITDNSGRLGSRFQPGDNLVEGRRKQRQDRAEIEGRNTKPVVSPLITQRRHVLLKADREHLLRDKARLGHSISSDKSDNPTFSSTQYGQLQQTVNRSSNCVVSSYGQKVDDDDQQTANSVRTDSRQLTESAVVNSKIFNSSVQHSASSSPLKRSDNPAAFNNDSNSFGQRMVFHRVGASNSPVKSNEVSNGSGFVVSQETTAARGKRLQETDIDMAVVQSSNQTQTGMIGHAVNASSTDDIVNNNSNRSDDTRPTEQAKGIEVMSYAEFVKNLSLRGIPAPQNVVRRHHGNLSGSTPQYSVHQHQQRKAHVRNLRQQNHESGDYGRPRRRHGYESEDGYVTGRPVYHHGYESEHSRPGRQHRTGYESDIGYRSDIAGLRSNQAPMNMSRSGVGSIGDIPPSRGPRVQQRSGGARIDSASYIGHNSNVHQSIREESVGDLVGHATLWPQNNANESFLRSRRRAPADENLQQRRQHAYPQLSPPDGSLYGQRQQQFYGGAGRAFSDNVAGVRQFSSGKYEPIQL